MSSTKKLMSVALLSIITGVGIGALIFKSDMAGMNMDMDSKTMTGNNTATEKEPLYWVAPMDASYRRDGPGKSLMGMDLIPVYEQSPSQEYGPGVVTISPAVVNNLGVRIATAKEGVLNTVIKTVGYVQYDEEQLKHIHPRVEGWVEKLYITAAGDPVSIDQPLYDLYSPQLVNAQEEYLLALGRNNKSLISAAENRLHALQLSKTFIQQLKTNRQVQQTITFNAPQSGVVDQLNIREGFFVNPSTTLMSIGKLDQVWVEAEIFERQMALVTKGLPITMTLDYLQGRQWHGEIDYIYPTLNPKTRTLRVRLRFENTDHSLKPNMFADVTIFAETAEKMLLVPREAIIRTGTHNTVVIALGEGQFKSVNVELGASDNQFTAITQGLNAGDNVVVSAQFLLDSESSKNSDFKRMHHSEPTQPVGAHHD